MTEQEIVKECLAEIFRRNGFSELYKLTQRDFDHMSQEILDKTGILISVSTIKRLLNGEFSRLPQIATLDAISRYLHYKSWHEYKSSQKNSEVPLLHEQKDLQPLNSERKKSLTQSNRIKLIAIASLGVVGIVILGFIQFSESTQLEGLNKASFSARKNTNNEIPNTVVFNYNIDNVKADSFFIQQSWDRNRRVRIFKKNYTLTDIYYEPGYHVAKLIANDSIIRTIDISIPTDRWFFYAKDNPGSNPEYISTGNSVKNGILNIYEEDILNSKIDLGKEKEYIYAFFPGKIEVSSDNYLLKTRVRMKEVKKNPCPYIMFEVFCQRYFMFVKSTTKGCASESMIMFGEHFISGKEKDLSPLGFDVTQWMDVEIVVKNKRATFMLDNKEVFSMPYLNSSGLITGLSFISNGLCQIDFVELKGDDGKIIYTNNFDSKSDAF